MEVRETAACGVAEREFAIDLMEHEIVKFYKFLNRAADNATGPDSEMVEDMVAQIRQIVGPTVDL